MIYALIVDDLAYGRSRIAARSGLDKTLARPLDPEEAAAHDQALEQAEQQRRRDEWGLSPEAIAASEHADRTLGDVTYESE